VIPPVQADSAYHSDRRHSKSSLSSAGEVPRNGTSASDWSEIGQEELADYGGTLQRATRLKHTTARRLGSSASSSRSPLTDTSIGGSSSALPTPPVNQTLHMRASSAASSPSSRSSHLEQPSPSPVYANFPRTARIGSATPTHIGAFPTPHAYSPPAGPSRPALGIHVDENPFDGMDPATRALIANMQQEEAESAMQRAEDKQRQLRADEEYARRQQDEEKKAWHAAKMVEQEERRRRNEQIERDARQAVSCVCDCAD
jgi:hypothetical protein